MADILLLLVCTILACFLPSWNWACSCEDLDEIKTKDDLKSYDFVALVKIEEIQDSSYTNQDNTNRTSTLSITILELFKGEKKHLKVSAWGRGSSCEMGIGKGEVWAIFGNYKDGFVTTSYCTHSFAYKNAMGELDWIYEREKERLEKLRDIYQITPNEPAKPLNGEYEEFYPNGKIAIKASYKNGLLEGKRTVYYATGELFGEEVFRKGKRHGKSVWYWHKNQKKAKEFAYKNNKEVGECLRYDFKGIVNNRYFYDRKGVFLKHKSFSDGFIESVFEVDKKTKDRISTSYYPKKELVFDDKQGMTLKNIDFKGDKIRDIHRIDTSYRDLYSIEYDKEGKIIRKFVYEYKDGQKITKRYNQANILTYLSIMEEKNYKMILEQEFDEKTGVLIKERKF